MRDVPFGPRSMHVLVTCLIWRSCIFRGLLMGFHSLIGSRVLAGLAAVCSAQAAVNRSPVLRSLLSGMTPRRLLSYLCSKRG